MTSNRSTVVCLILFGLAVGMGLVMTAGLLIEAPEGSSGRDHALHSVMLEGGDGIERLGNVRWLWLVFGLLQIAFYVGCMVLGLKRPPKAATVLLILFGILYAGTFALLVNVDQAWARGDTQMIIWGLPLPTAIMMYGVGGVPVLFTLLYVIQFDRWVVTKLDLEQLDELVRRKQQESDA